MHFREIGIAWRRWPQLLLLAWSLSLTAGPSAADPGAAADAEVARLLDAAEAAERNGQLIYPASGSAMSFYHEVLFVDPDNDRAIAGLVRLAEHHLVEAQLALQAGQLLKADSMVSKARMIYPQYPGVAAMSRQVRLLQSAERTRVTLDWRLVAARSDELTGQLQQLGGLAKGGDCRVTISVSNDAEGRWIYQHMNQATGTGRVRAEVRIESPSAVDVLCFDESEDGV